MILELKEDITRVIVQNNETPARVGTFEGWQELRGNYFPLVRFDDDKKQYIAMGVILPYHEGLLQLLHSLPYKESWELARDISVVNQIVKRKSSERYRKGYNELPDY